VSASLGVQLTCNGCGRPTYVPKSSVPAARVYAAHFLNTVTYVALNGLTQDLCAVCQQNCTFVDVTIETARTEVHARRAAALTAAGVDPGDTIAVDWSDDDEPMRTTYIVGPTTGRLYEAHDTGDTWNGAPILAFTLSDLLALIKAGDGADGNGYGLENHAGRIVDVTGPDDEIPVPTLIADVRGDTLVLYVPQGRTWDETTTAEPGDLA